MYYNNNKFNKLQQDKINTINNLINIGSWPCKVKEYKDNYKVDVYSLVDNTIKTDIPILYIPGYSYKLENIKYGLCISIAYNYISIIENENENKQIKAPPNNSFIFIPIYSTSNNKQKDNKEYDITIHSNSNNDKIEVKDNEVSITSNNININPKATVDISNDTASLKDCFTELINTLKQSFVKPAANGKPLDETFAVQIQAVEAKINALLK